MDLVWLELLVIWLYPNFFLPVPSPVLQLSSWQISLLQGISHSHRLLHAALTFVRVLRELTSSNFKSGHGLWFYLRSSCFSLDFLTFREVILHLPGSNWSFPMLTNYLLFSLWLAFRNVRKAANIYSNNLCEQLWIAWIIRATCWVCESLRSLNVMDLVRWSLHN
jgi:hypothetical protein